MLIGDIQTIEGSPGLQLTEVGHLMVPGGGRNNDGMGLSEVSAARTEYAATIDDALRLAEGENQDMSVVVCSGYKTPGDTNGKAWTPSSPGEPVQKVWYQGIPEAYSMRRLLIGRGIAPERIRPEAGSIDTTTNFLHSQAEFPDDRPVGIVTDRQ